MYQKSVTIYKYIGKQQKKFLREIKLFQYFTEYFRNTKINKQFIHNYLRFIFAEITHTTF